MAISYRVKRNVISITSDSHFNNKKIDLEDFIARTPNGWEALPAKVIDSTKYGVFPHEAAAFASILANIFNNPFEKDRVFESEV